MTDDVDLTRFQYPQECEMGCGRDATLAAKGCMDKRSVWMCDECFERGLEIVDTAVHLFKRLNKRIMVCGDCHRPILTLETHLEVTRLSCTPTPSS